MPTTWTEVGDHAAGLIRALVPESPIFAAVGAVLAMGGRGADFWVRQQARKQPPPGTHEILDAQIAYLRRKTAPPPAPPAPSRYLAEEGQPTGDTDCFNCASAHLAAFAGALAQAATAAERAGTCDDSCQRWMQLALQEPGILLEHDWPATKRWPEAQQAVVDRYRPQVQALWQESLGTDSTAESVTLVALAAAGLKEATRFTRAGDPVDHPEVERRRLQAEQALASAERLDIRAWDAETATAIRRLRQQVSGGLTDNEALVQAAAQADRLALTLSARQAAQVPPARLRALADRAQALHQQFAAERRAAGTRTAASVAATEAVFAQRQLFEDTDTRIPGVLAGSLLEGTAPAAPAPPAPVDPDLRPLVGATPQTERAIVNLLRLEAARGVPVRIEELPTVIENGQYAGQVLGAYYPAGDALLLGPQVWAEDPEDVNTVMEEVAHSILHNRRCDIYTPQPGTPYLEIPEEREAKAATLLALLATGIPVETDTGRVIPTPAVRQEVDQTLARMDPLMRHRASWAAQILTQAVQGDIQGAAEAAQACPKTLPRGGAA
jgi:hypothetical protein